MLLRYQVGGRGTEARPVGNRDKGSLAFILARPGSGLQQEHGGAVLGSLWHFSNLGT